MAAVIRRHSERGAALVEFAIVIPLLLLLFAAMIDFGLMFQRFLVLTNAAREGARMAVLPGYDTADVTNRVTAYYSAGTTPGSTPVSVVLTQVTIDPGLGAPFQAAQVVATTTHTPFVLRPIVTFFGGTFADITLRATAAMRIEGGA